jgi:uncharacterized protein (TIGR03545 family)
MPEIKDVSAKSKTNINKSKGPTRFEAVIPIGIIGIIIWLYATFLLDGHIRRGLEYTSSKLYGAQVDVASVKIRFGDPSLTIGRIQVTNKDHPMMNAVEIGQIRFAMLWDALLRGKLVIDESSITEISVNSARKSPGLVYPPAPPPVDEGPGLTDKITQDLKAEVEAQLSKNGFAEVAKILGGADAGEQLKQFRDQLVSESKIKELQTTLTVKQGEWTKRIQELPRPELIQATIQKIKATNINVSNPVEAKNKLESLKKDLDQAQSIVDSYQNGQKDIQADIGGFQEGLKQIDEAAKNDLKFLQDKFKLPEIDEGSLTKALIARLMGDKLQKLMGFVVAAKAYMPTKTSSKEKPEFIPHPRGRGRTYKFPVTVGYPLFWLKTALISSKATPDGFSGNFGGQLLNVTTDPALINRPTVLEVTGSAPKQEIEDLGLKLVMDYRQGDGRTTLNFDIGRYPFPAQSFVESDDVSFSLKPSKAALKVNALFASEEMNAKIQQLVKNPEFNADAKAPLLKEALLSATSKIGNLGMTVTLSGGFLSPKIGFDSNLGSELANGLERHLKAKIDAEKSKLKSFVDGRIQGERQKLMAEYAKAQNALDSILKGKDAEFRSLQADLQKAYKEKGSGESKKLQDDLKKKGSDLFKQLGR